MASWAWADHRRPHGGSRGRGLDRTAIAGEKREVHFRSIGGCIGALRGAALALGRHAGAVSVLRRRAALRPKRAFPPTSMA